MVRRQFMGVSGLTVVSPHLSEDAAAQPVVAPLIVGPDGALVNAMAAGGEAWLLSRTHEPWLTASRASASSAPSSPAATALQCAG